MYILIMLMCKCPFLEWYCEASEKEASSSNLFKDNLWVLVVLGLYLVLNGILSIWYYRKVRRSDKLGATLLRLAPPVVRGKFPNQIGSRETGMLLLIQLHRAIAQARRIRGGCDFMYASAEIAKDFQIISPATEIIGQLKNPTELEIREDLVVQVGTVSLPVGALVRLAVWLVRKVPFVLYRNRYLDTLVQLTVVEYEGEMQIIVNRGNLSGRRSPKGGNGNDELVQTGTGDPVEKTEALSAKAKDAETKVDNDGDAGPDGRGQVGPRILHHSGRLASMSDYHDGMRQAAFMVLELMEGAGRSGSGRSQRRFFDGIDALDEYRTGGDKKKLKFAEASFRAASEEDPGYHLARFFLGSLMLNKRTHQSIQGALAEFHHACETHDFHLKALVYSGIAQCHVQEFHRLAKRDPIIIRKANSAAEDAVVCWKKAQKDKAPETRVETSIKCRPYLLPLPTSRTDLPSWLYFTKALVAHADENMKPNKRRIESFLKAARYYRHAIDLDWVNGQFYNNLGWVLLKLSEFKHRCIKESEIDDPELLEYKGSTCRNAIRMFRLSLEIQPGNKLCHANLCLAYAVREMREANRDRNLARSRYHGKRALQIDPDYINGHRDLAFSLLAYEKYDEAFRLFTKALLLSARIEKDLEMLDDAENIFVRLSEEGVEIPTKEKLRWLNPAEDLLDPPPETPKAFESGPGPWRL